MKKNDNTWIRRTGLTASICLCVAGIIRLGVAIAGHGGIREVGESLLCFVLALVFGIIFRNKMPSDEDDRSDKKDT